MEIVNPARREHAAFRTLVDAEIRPGGGGTHAWDDFPLVLDDANRADTLVVRDGAGGVAAGLAALVRDFATNWGPIAIAGLGSVVTRPDHRGRGLSRALQDEMLRRLRARDVPLAVLWTDRPEVYAGRGFTSAGWERHVVLDGADLPAPRDVRPYAPEDATGVARLYDRHPWRTLRRAGESARLYAMPGTRGLVAAAAGGAPRAAAFCGKGADFPDYVTEWSGPVEAVLPLLAEVRGRGWAGRVLVPQGGEDLGDEVVRRGGAWFACPSGQWCVLRPDLLAGAAARAGAPVAPPNPAAATAWLGGVADDGRPVDGPLRVAVWGFDSV